MRLKIEFVQKYFYPVLAKSGFPEYQARPQRFFWCIRIASVYGQYHLKIYELKFKPSEFFSAIKHIPSGTDSVWRRRGNFLLSFSRNYTPMKYVAIWDLILKYYDFFRRFWFCLLFSYFLRRKSLYTMCVSVFWSVFYLIISQKRWKVNFIIFKALHLVNCRQRFLMKMYGEIFPGGENSSLKL